MLFIESKFTDCDLDGAARGALLESLQESVAEGLIQHMRRRCYEMALGKEEGAGEKDERLKHLERTIAELSERDKRTSYVQGDLFCADDHVLFLMFRGGADERAEIQAGIIYTAETLRPLMKLDDFCRKLRERIIITTKAKEGGNSVMWRRGNSSDRSATPAFERFLAKQDVDFLYTSARRETAAQRGRAAELLEDSYTREFLRRTREAHLEGCATKLLKGETSGDSTFSVGRLSEAGLVLREVLVSCRTTGHALFRLPSADALAIITVSKAKCSECGALVADERVEDVIAPTELAAALLQDASWLVNRIYTIIRRLGVPATEIAIAPVTGHGEAHIMVNLCNEPFLFVLRDGDLTPALARRAIDAEMEMGVSRLVIVTTGRVREEARLFLSEHAERRTRGGTDIEVMIIEGVETVASELGRALERFSHHLIAEQLCRLDANLGFSASRLVMARFDLLRTAAATNVEYVVPADIVTAVTHTPNKGSIKYLPPALDHNQPDVTTIDNGRDLSFSL